ncbi:MAG TPA: gamma-glutamyltransferase [Candidatus Acidoferrum sp.]|nr:gamma-glutamyltransferase [Candidatus Acidoferrum sp.]
MKNARFSRLCISLFSFVFPLAILTAAQNAAEYNERAETEKPWPQQAVRAAHGMVATDEELGSRAGIEILQKGGNAVDAAVATAFALAVVEPAAGNIGGGGFMLIRLASGKTTFFDYREVAPGRATRDMYVLPNGKLDPEASTLGYKSVAVPGTVAGLELVLKTYGTMKLAEAMAPAIRLADEGFAVSAKLAAELVDERRDLQRFSVSRRIFLKDGAMYRAGDTLKQPELAATLKRIAKNGAAEVYRGETARMLVDDMARLGGLITIEDLANYQPKVREPLHAHYELDGHKWDLIAAPPPSSGGVAVIEALNMLDGVQLKSWDDPQSVHIMAEVMRRIFADRAAYLADPDFAKVPVDGLTSPCYAKELRSTIDAARASSSKAIQAGQPHVCGTEASIPAPQEISLNDGPHTTHFSVVDAAGNAVASTYTMNDSYGSHATSRAGFLLNDEMDDFTTQPGVPNALYGLMQSEANAIAPGHRPLSSMTPTILVRDGKLSFVTGSPGGPRIISAVLLSIVNWMKLGMDAQAAINAPRFHHQWFPDVVVMEPQFSAHVQNALNTMGHRTRKIGHIGLVNAIGIDVTTGERLGAADPRDEGSAVGY